MTLTEVSGYKLTQRAQTEAMMSGLGDKAIRSLFVETTEQWPMPHDLWMITDGRNTALISPYDNLVTSLAKGSRKPSNRP